MNLNLKQMVIDAIKNSGKSDSEIERDLELPRSTIYDWTHGRSASYKNYKLELSRYFGIDFNYESSTKKSAPAKQEPIDENAIYIINIMSSLSDEDKRYILGVFDGAVAVLNQSKEARRRQAIAVEAERQFVELQHSQVIHKDDAKG